MPDIKIKVEGKQATLAEDAVIVCGNSDYVALFSFDEEWAKHTPKTARFVWRSSGVLKYIDTLFTGDSCPIPVLSGAREVRIGVYAGNLQTTTAAFVPCEPSVRCGAQKLADPEPDVYDQIIEMIEAGMLKGEKGEKGEKGDPGYTPQKGVDYWTEADKTEMAKETKEQLLPNSRPAVLYVDVYGNLQPVKMGHNFGLQNGTLTLKTVAPMYIPQTLIKAGGRLEVSLSQIESGTKFGLLPADDNGNIAAYSPVANYAELPAGTIGWNIVVQKAGKYVACLWYSNASSGWNFLAKVPVTVTE